MIALAALKILRVKEDGWILHKHLWRNVCVEHAVVPVK